MRLIRKCQCPLGLIPHFYWKSEARSYSDHWGSVSMPSRAYTSFLHASRSSLEKMASTGVNALSGLYLISTVECGVGPFIFKECQCPLGLIPHFYRPRNRLFRSVYHVSMPSRAYTSFLRYPFKNLGFMRFTEPVFAGIYQNILTTAVFRAC